MVSINIFFELHVATFRNYWCVIAEIFNFIIFLGITRRLIQWDHSTRFIRTLKSIYLAWKVFQTRAFQCKSKQLFPFFCFWFFYWTEIGIDDVGFEKFQVPKLSQRWSQWAIDGLPMSTWNASNHHSWIVDWLRLFRNL